MPRPCENSHPDSVLPTSGTPFVDGDCRFCWLYVHREDYRVKWGGRLEDYPLLPREALIQSKEPVGTTLKTLLTSIGLPSDGQCGCESLARRMDLWGIEGCQQHREGILTKLREEGGKRGWWEKLKAGTLAFSQRLILNPLDPAPGLLDEALRKCGANITAKETLASTPKTVTWSYGVTTCAARLEGLLPDTLRSLRKAGFEEPRLFVDGCRESELPSYVKAHPHTCRHPSVQVAGNLVLGLWELYHRSPRADLYAMFQDDCLASGNLRGYLERCEYPSQGYWSLYTSAENYKLCQPGYHGWYESNQLGKGAVGLVFNRQTLLTLLGSPHILNRPQDERKGHKSIDGGIVTALAKAGVREYVHNPSLLEHTGSVSVQNPQRHPTKVMKAGNWLGEDFDLTTLL